MKQKKVAVCILLIGCLCMVSSCNSNQEDGLSTGPATTFGLEDQKNIDSGSYIRYLYRQEQWAERMGAELNSIKGRDSFAQWLSEQGDLDVASAVYVEREGIFGEPAYKVTATSDTNYLYYGEIDNFYPNGFGVLWTTRDMDVDGIPNIVYMGEFKKGHFNGYGIKFSIPNGEAVTLSQVISPWNSDSAEYANFYYDFLNYASFEGTFKEGKAKKGKGNAYVCDISGLFYMGYFSRVGVSIEDIGYQIYISEFDDGEENGNTQCYSLLGGITYDGKMVDGVKDGRGKEYYFGGTQLKYDGEFKNGKYSGTGTLYDENGQILFSGKWEDGVSATGITDNEEAAIFRWVRENQSSLLQSPQKISVERSQTSFPQGSSVTNSADIDSYDPELPVPDNSFLQDPEENSAEPPDEITLENAVITMVDQWLNDPNNPAGDFKDNWELINYDFSWGGDEGAETRYVLYATVRIYIRYEESYLTEDLSVIGSAWWNGYEFSSISYAT